MDIRELPPQFAEAFDGPSRRPSSASAGPSAPTSDTRHLIDDLTLDATGRSEVPGLSTGPSEVGRAGADHSSWIARLEAARAMASQNRKGERAASEDGWARFSRARAPQNRKVERAASAASEDGWARFTRARAPLAPVDGQTDSVGFAESSSEASTVRIPVQSRPVAPPRTDSSARVLIAQLEHAPGPADAEAERLRRELERSVPASVLAAVDVEVPPPPPRRRAPEWIWAALVVLVVLVGLGYAYTRAEETPAPAAEVDEAFQAAAVRKKEALLALEQGHGAVLDEKYERAIVLYKKALRLQPDFASAERGLGIAYAALGRRSRAIRHYERFIELEPNGMEAAKVKALIREYKRKARRRRDR